MKTSKVILFVDKKFVHECHLEKDVHTGIDLAWTLCGQDVSVNMILGRREEVTCPECLRIVKEIN